MEKQLDNPEARALAEARGLALMSQRDVLLYAVGCAGPSELGEATDKLITWHDARTAQDWQDLAAAEFGTRALRRALVLREAECSPIGQRR